MRGKAQHTCVLCGKRRTYCRRVPFAFQEQGFSEDRGVIVSVGIGRIYPPDSPICFEHNYVLAPEVIEQLSLFQEVSP